MVVGVWFTLRSGVWDRCPRGLIARFKSRSPKA